LRRATSVSHQRITRWPPTSSSVSSTAGLEQAPADHHRQVAPVVAQRRDQHQQRHHGQILEQQHAHHAAAVLALQLEPLGHQLDDDGGRRHGHRAPSTSAPCHDICQLCAGEPCHPDQQRVAGQRAEHGQHHLRQPQPEDQGAHAAQLGQVELEPDDEHQEHDAELGQVADAGTVLGQRQGVGADQHAHHQVAQHRRQLQRAADTTPSTAATRYSRTTSSVLAIGRGDS
jgi:hypothetical protein